MAGEQVDRIIVTIDDQYLLDIEAVVTALETAGMQVNNVLSIAGIITGEVSDSKIQDLKSLPGVVDVEIDQEMQTV